MSEFPILTYHRVSDEARGPRGITVPLREFIQQMDLLQEKGFKTIDLEAFTATLLEGKPIRGRSVLITFDDGYEEVYSLARPLLRERGLKAAVFIATGSIGGTNSWDQPGDSLKVLSGEHILALSRDGWDIAAHSHTHPHLNNCSDEAARKDIRSSKILLEELLGKPVQAFCYPYGECSVTVKQIVRSEGFTCAFASDSGPRDFRKDPFEIRRIGIFPGLSRAGFLRKISGFYHRYRRLTAR